MNLVTPLVNLDSPSERSSRLAPGRPLPSRVNERPRAPPTEFCCPSAHQEREHPLHHRLAPAPATALPQPLRSAFAVSTTLTVYAALARPQVSLGNTHGLSSFRALPEPPGAPPSLVVPPLLAFLRTTPALCGGSRRVVRPRLQGLTPAVRPSPPDSGFPSSGVRDPHGLSFGTSPREPPLR